jgi:Fe-S-cluster containining protein
VSEDRDDQAYGTADPDAPVSRSDFERALRCLHMSDVDLRDAMLKLAAQVVALTDELTRRLDGVEPQPAPPRTPAAPPVGTVEEAVAAQVGDTLAQIRAADVAGGSRVSLDASGDDKYEVTPVAPPCEELMPICQARCCKLSFALSTQDLDERVIRWDYGQPYLIAQRASDAYCVHNDPETHFCTVHAYRPRICRLYDCSKDDRIWIDYENRIPAPTPEYGTREAEPKGGTRFELMERVRKRAIAVHAEAQSIAESFAMAEAVRGPAPKRR